MDVIILDLSEPSRNMMWELRLLLFVIAREMVHHPLKVQAQVATAFLNRQVLGALRHRFGAAQSELLEVRQAVRIRILPEGRLTRIFKRQEEGARSGVLKHRNNPRPGARLHTAPVVEASASVY